LLLHGLTIGLALPVQVLHQREVYYTYEIVGGAQEALPRPSI